jgi:hypothetical protein
VVEETVVAVEVEEAASQAVTVAVAVAMVVVAMVEAEVNGEMLRGKPLMITPLVVTEILYELRYHLKSFISTSKKNDQIYSVIFERIYIYFQQNVSD